MFVEVFAATSKSMIISTILELAGITTFVASLSVVAYATAPMSQYPLHVVDTLQHNQR